MAYTVFIPTAGTGSRLGGLTKYLNKSLVSIENKPTLSRIIEMFPEDTRFVVAVGYKGDIVKEFIQLAYPEGKIVTRDVYPYEGEGSGLGYTISCCRDLLQCPFIFCSCDTLVAEHIPSPDHNWMGWDDRDIKNQYRTISLSEDGEYVKSINEKGRDCSDSAKPYIGLCGIHDYEMFWAAMDKKGEEVFSKGESFGLQKLVNDSTVKAHKFTWFDTGVTVELEATRQRFKLKDGPNILEKANESIWFLKEKVIKFSSDTSFIHDRVERSKILEGFVPPVLSSTPHMYSYAYVHGNVLSKCVSLPIFKQLLNASKLFWKEKVFSSPDEETQFYKSCMSFYKDKTYKRVELFFDVSDKKDEATVINDVWYPPLKDMLRQVDWDFVARGTPGQFHGDFHFENILYDETKESFELLDWRQNFGGSLTTGDIYYDMAKLLHGLIMCHDLVAKDEYFVNWQGNEIRYDFNRKQLLVECENYYYQWLEKHGYSVQKVKLLTALIYLNIAGLHAHPYSLVLFALGKELLQESLME